jgi:hypothetical protein
MRAIKISILILLVLILLVLFLLVLRGYSDRIIPDRKVYFIDSNSNEIIPSVLIIPMYATAWCIRNVEGEGPGKAVILLDNPFVYSSNGLPLSIKQPRSHGIFVGVFIGKAISLDGVIAIAKGYESAVIYGDVLYRGPDGFNWILKPLKEKEAKEQLGQISNIIGKNEFKELIPASAQEPDPFKDHFSKKDIKMMKDFFGITTPKN